MTGHHRKTKKKLMEMVWKCPKNGRSNKLKANNAMEASGLEESRKTERHMTASNPRGNHYKCPGQGCYGDRR